MRKEIVKCRDCHFWIPYTKEERGRGLGLEEHETMPFLPFTELAHAHARRRLLRVWRTENWRTEGGVI